jgi:hypothetical protein
VIQALAAGRPVQVSGKLERGEIALDTIQI